MLLFDLRSTSRKSEDERKLQQTGPLKIVPLNDIYHHPFAYFHLFERATLDNGMTKVVELKEAPANGRKAVLLFYAPWHDSTTIMTGVLDALASSTTDNDDTMLFAKVHAEEAPDLSKKYQVTSVPTFVLLQTDGSVVNKIEGANQVAALTQAVQKLTQAASVEEAKTSTADTEAQLKARLDGLIRSAPVMLFMKGNPSAPRCGFSRQAVALFEAEEIPFGSFDILSDETVRQGLKKHSDWPTYPQVYVHGELVGGLDVSATTRIDSRVPTYNMPRSTSKHVSCRLPHTLFFLIYTTDFERNGGGIQSRECARAYGQGHGKSSSGCPNVIERPTQGIDQSE